jgi:hypothetical protein
MWPGSVRTPSGYEKQAGPTGNRRELVRHQNCHTSSMMGRRTAALLCVLLAHALILFALMNMKLPAERRVDELAIAPITLMLDPLPVQSTLPLPPEPAPHPAARRPPVSIVAGPMPGESAAIVGAAVTPGRVDWPIEGKKSAAKVLAMEAEARRIARMFSGPDGTWASLTPRERSRLKKFRWKPGVDGLEYDEHGNAIYHISEGCVVVNIMFIGCTLGKAQVHGDLFKDMHLYFDEHRLPPLDTGNGQETPQR